MIQMSAKKEHHEKKAYVNDEERIKARTARDLQTIIETCPEQNRELYQRYINSYVISGSSFHTIDNKTHTLKRWNELIKKDIAELNKSDIESILTEFSKQKLEMSSKSTYIANLKTLLKFAEREDLNKHVIKPVVKANDKLPDDLLTKEEVAELIRNTVNPRDKALISLLYESGARRSEMLGLKIKHITAHEKGIYVHFPRGKTGARKILIVYSSMYLNQWLINHPEKDNRDAFLWCQLTPPYEPFTYSGLRKILTGAAKRANISKKVNPHAFRHAQATELAKVFTEQQMKRYLGWTSSSKMASVYVHLSGIDIDNAVLAKNGIELEEKDTRLKPDECPRCHRMIPPESVYCGFCGLSLNGDADKKVFSIVEEFIKQLKENPEKLLEFMSLHKGAEKA